MDEIVLFEIAHIRLIISDTGAPCLIVKDTDLNDYVEDFLWDDYQYESTSVSMQGRSGPVTYFNYFDNSIQIEEVVQALKNLDQKEVERIFNSGN